MKSEYYSHERADLVSLIPKSAKRILEIGCGEGALGARIKKTGENIEVTGIEIDSSSCKTAEKNLDKIICGNIETLELPFREGEFDCIVAADVLEHLVDPWESVAKLSRFLKSDGVFVASIPNIRYYKAVIRLLNGCWDYTSQGIFDRSHLRFFCRVNVEEMFEGAGFAVQKIVRNQVSARGFRILNYALLGSLKDFLTYQYYVVARKTTSKSTKKTPRKIAQF